MTLFLNYDNGTTKINTYRNPSAAVTDITDICERAWDGKPGLLVASISDSDWWLVESVLGYHRADYEKGK